MPTAVCLGEALVDFVADVSSVSLAECPGFRKAPGGAPANVAVGLARLGVAAAFLGKVGEDPFGQFLADSYADAGVDTRFVRFDSTARTGLAFVALQANGEREFVFFRNPSADMLYRPDEVPEAALAGVRAFHYGSITLIQEPSRSATLETLARARRAGAFISYDPNLRPLLWPSLEAARQEILVTLPFADVVKVSGEEAEFLFGPGTPAEQAQRLLELGPRLAAITLGAEGSYLAGPHGTAMAPGFPVDAVDTTGAGDGFVAGLLSGLLDRGWSPSESAASPLEAKDLACLGRFANAVGALTCLKKGAIPALPERSAVERLLRGERKLVDAF